MSIPVDRGFTFDENLNMRCSKCGAVVVPSKADAQVELDSALNKKNWNSPVKAYSSLNADGYGRTHPVWKNDPDY